VRGVQSAQRRSELSAVRRIVTINRRGLMTVKEKVAQLDMAEAGSQMQREFEQDQGLAERYLAEANAKDLFELYQKRCRQLNEFGNTLGAMAEMYAGKSGARIGDFASPASPNAVASMEKVALAAIELAKVVAGKTK
jgi:hypothetical protein